MAKTVKLGLFLHLWAIPMAIIWSLFSLWLVLSRAEGSILDPLQGRDESENTSLAPTTTPGDVWTDSQGLYPYSSPGTLPLIIGEVGNFQDGLQKSTGWLVARDPRCNNPTYIVACPINEPNPCCHPNYPVCCHPSQQCCPAGYFCVAYPRCCRIGLVGCGSNCCPAGTTCCDGTACCRSGYNCVEGRCINPQLSILSTQSVASVQSMSTIASISRASVASVSSISRASVASVESTQSVASVQSMATISSMSRASVASVSSIQASLSSALVTQAGHTNSDTVTTASVKPNDDRIKYEPTSAWFNSTSGTGSSSSSPIGVCTNGTKVTETAGAKFTFVFEGTSISLDIIASTSGGKFTVAVDGGAAMDYSSLQTSNSGGDQCIPSRVVSITNLLEAAHQIVVINGISASGSSGGKLEFNGITYTGKGAFGTPDNQSTRSSAAVIGGSVGGAVGAIVIIGGTIAYFMYRKRRTQSGELANNGGGAGAGAAIDQMSQNTSNPVNNTIASYVVPTAMSSPSTFGNQSLPSQQQQFGYPPQQQYYPLQQQHPYAYQQYGQGSTSQINPAVAPLPSWVQRASQANDSSSPPMRPADAVSMTSATHSQVHMAYGGMANPVNTSNNPMHQPNAFYGTHYTPNQQSYNTGQYQ